MPCCRATSPSLDGSVPGTSCRWRLLSRTARLPHRVFPIQGHPGETKDNTSKTALWNPQQPETGFDNCSNAGLTWSPMISSTSSANSSRLGKGGKACWGFQNSSGCRRAPILPTDSPPHRSTNCHAQQCCPAVAHSHLEHRIVYFHNETGEHFLRLLTCCSNSNARLLRRTAMSGWLGPSAFSPTSIARRYNRSASSYFPCWGNFWVESVPCAISVTRWDRYPPEIPFAHGIPTTLR